jgi:glycine cleavage system H protein
MLNVEPWPSDVGCSLRVATSFYKRSNFVTHLPVECLYSPSHYWIGKVAEGRWRVGFTKFATRMLGEIVEVRLEKSPGAKLVSGEIVGTIEGFKAISDLYSCAAGTFAGANPALASNVELVSEKPYGEGWLYEVDGEPDSRCMPFEAYKTLLDSTIDRILEKQAAEETE